MPKKSDLLRRDTQLIGGLAKRLTETLQEASKLLDDQSAQGALARGKVLQCSDYFVEAADSYADALALDPELEEAAARLVVAQLKARQPERALASATKLAARNPGFELRELSSDQHASALTLLGDALVHNGRVQDAIEAYKAASGVSRKDSFAAGRLAQLFLSTGEPKKAIERTKDFANNPRFRDFSSVLALGQRSEALLPAFRGNSVVELIANTAHGRPLLVDGEARVASIAWGDDAWCADGGGEQAQ
jgi:tetratricopeptide (TPR) repeat protein